MKGEITVFLSLIFLLLISFITIMIEIAFIQVSKNYARADMSSAVESLFAEYQRDLLQHYGIFAIEATYETGDFSYDRVLQRAEYYGAEGIDMDISYVRLLTDHNGRGFYEQAVAYIKSKLDMEIRPDIREVIERWEEKQHSAKEIQNLTYEVTRNLDHMLSQGEVSIPSENNPIETITNLTEYSLLSLIVPSQERLSKNVITIENVASRRALRQGYGKNSNLDYGMFCRFIFSEYLLHKFQCAVSEKQEQGLSYEIEYLIAGKPSDQENLEVVANQLLLLRVVQNYEFLLQDMGRQEEARAMAEMLLTIYEDTENIGIMKQAILLAWAYEEGAADVKALLNDEENDVEGRYNIGGLSYRDYLRILLFMGEKKHLTMRAIDLIELNLSEREGLAFFKADNCIVNLGIDGTSHLGRGITYSFSVSYGYK